MTKRNRAVGNGTATAEVLNVTVKGLKEEEEGSGKESGGSIRVLDRAMSVLGFMAESRRQVGITEIADAVGLSKATVHRILSTLRDYSVVLKDDSGRYQMGPSVLFWADAYRHRAGLAEISRPLLRRLWEESHETVHLFIFEGGEAYYLDKLDSPHPVGMRSRIGAKRDLYSTSGGRAILAALSEAELDAYLDRTELLPRTENTVTDKEELKNLLAAGRERVSAKKWRRTRRASGAWGPPSSTSGAARGGGEHQCSGLSFQRQPSLALGAKIRETAWPFPGNWDTGDNRRSEAGKSDNKEEEPMEVRNSANPADVKRYDTEALRGEFLIRGLFAPDEIPLVYSHVDRMITGSACPVSKSLSLKGGKELGVDFFLQRREMAVLNIGDPGTVVTDGTSRRLNRYEALYIGMGTKDVSFEPETGSTPKFYLLSCPAHSAWPTTLITREMAVKQALGTKRNATNG